MDWGADYEKGRQVFGFGSLLAPVALALFIVSVQSCGNSTAPCQCLQLDAYLNPHTRQHQRVRLLVFVSSPHNDESTRAKTTGLVCVNVAFVSAVSLLDADLRMC